MEMLLAISLFFLILLRRVTKGPVFLGCYEESLGLFALFLAVGYLFSGYKVASLQLAGRLFVDLWLNSHKMGGTTVLLILVSRD
ncbi:MAG: hypothetical protein IBV52_08585 [Candidatus Bathyarchaeota archaeon]